MVVLGDGHGLAILQDSCCRALHAVTLTEIHPVSSTPLIPREQYLHLVRLLEDCVDPYGVAADVLADALGIAEEMSHEMGSLLDGIIEVARLQQIELPQDAVSEIRHDLYVMGRLDERYELRILLGAEMRDRCGHTADPGGQRVRTDRGTPCRYWP